MQNPASIFTVRPAVHVPSAEGGTRTHAPLRTNGFQDRLVMTTSISLQSVARFRSAKKIISKVIITVKHKFGFFSKKPVPSSAQVFSATFLLFFYDRWAAVPAFT